jgi:hypothetical protein
MNSADLQDTKSTCQNQWHFYISVAIIWNGNQESNFIYNSYKNKTKCMEINSIKEVKDLYNENYKILINQSEENTHTHTHTKWKGILCYWIRRINIVKMSIAYYPKWYIDSTQSLTKSMTFFTELENTNLKFVWKHKHPPPLIAKPFWEKTKQEALHYLTSKYTIKLYQSKYHDIGKNRPTEQ